MFSGDGLIYLTSMRCTFLKRTKVDWLWNPAICLFVKAEILIVQQFGKAYLADVKIKRET